MTEKPEKDLFTPLFAPDLYRSWRMSLKQMFLASLETNERMTKEALAWYEKAMAWTKDTPWAPVCKTFVASTSKFVEDTSSLLRSMWHLEHTRDSPDKLQKT